MREVLLGSELADLVACVADWLQAEPSLLALDAPLGWPAALGAALASHQAGAGLAGEAHQLFRRETDRFTQRLLGKTPLDVGADRIARTAHAALGLLARLREHTGEALPLAWSPELTQSAVIESYPASTLLTRGLPARQYKAASPEQRAMRGVILQGLSADVELGTQRDRLLAQADCLDALLCCLGGADFLGGACLPPEDLPLARKEGWIWQRAPVE